MNPPPRDGEGNLEEVSIYLYWGKKEFGQSSRNSRKSGHSGPDNRDRPVFCCASGNVNTLGNKKPTEMSASARSGGKSLGQGVMGHGPPPPKAGGRAILGDCLGRSLALQSQASPGPPWVFPSSSSLPCSVSMFPLDKNPALLDQSHPGDRVFVWLRLQ